MIHTHNLRRRGNKLNEWMNVARQHIYVSKRRSGEPYGGKPRDISRFDLYGWQTCVHRMWYWFDEWHHGCTFTLVHVFGLCSHRNGIYTHKCQIHQTNIPNKIIPFFSMHFDKHPRNQTKSDIQIKIKIMTKFFDSVLFAIPSLYSVSYLLFPRFICSSLFGVAYKLINKYISVVTIFFFNVYAFVCVYVCVCVAFNIILCRILYMCLFEHCWMS